MGERSRGTSKGDRAATLKKAAIEVFAENGYHDAKVSAIVQRVGVAQGTFYLYFKSKQEMFGELLQDFLALMHEPIADWDVGRLDSLQSYQDSLIELGDTLLPVVVANQALARIFFNEARVVPVFAAQLQEFYDTLIALLTTFNERMYQQDLIREMDFEVLAISTIGLVERNLLQFIILPHESASRERLERVTRQIVDHFIYGAGRRGEFE